MVNYKFLPHTADAKFQAYGKTIEEAFTNAALALTSIIIDPNDVKPRAEEKISASGGDEKALLYSFLEEFLFLLDAKGFVTNHIQKIKIQEKELTAIAVGDYVDDSYKLHGSVKAITYNEMEIIREEGRVTVQAVADV